MLDYILENIGFSSEDSAYIKAADKKYGTLIREIADRYADNPDFDPLVLKETNTRDALWKRANAFSAEIHSHETQEVSRYTLELLFWLYLIPCMEQRYKKYNISSAIMWDTAKDILYKVEECKTVYGVIGVFTNWFFLMVDLRLFSIGRLHYEIATLDIDEISIGGCHMGRGDFVLSCHIPSAGPLLQEDCEASVRMAYEFFAPYLKNDILPLFLRTWILYPPYIDKVYRPGSNLYNFARMFIPLNISGLEDPQFGDCWRIFGVDYTDAALLPADNSLRKAMAEYLKNGGTPGRGEGIILYDGKNDKMIGK